MQNPTFSREDWTLFRTPDGLQQRAGVTKEMLPRLVLKEIVDNGLDNGAHVTIRTLPGDSGGYIVMDDGTGIDGEPEDIAYLFSIGRPMISSKLLKLPTRGMVGNGLRVVAGAVLVSDGSLVVSTRNRRITLRPERDGSTTVVSVKPIALPRGTSIEIRFGPGLPCDANAMAWANNACSFAHGGESYSGKSSPWWYDAAQFHELLYASGTTPVRGLIAHLDGCTGANAKMIVAAAGLARAICANVTRPQAEKLLLAARGYGNPVNPKRLGFVGPTGLAGGAYACSRGTAVFGSVEPQAEIPFVVEAWARKSNHDDTQLYLFVNRTPTTGAIEAARDKRDIDAYGCGLHHNIAKAPKDLQFDIVINIITPHLPITSDGKAPDLMPFLDQIVDATSKAVRKVQRPQAGSGKMQKDIVLDNLDAVIAAVSGEGRYRFNVRQLLYRLRPIVMNETGKAPMTGNFAAIITDYENEHGEIRGMYREPRGTIYHPHRRETITLGTLMVEQYERPVWTFNKLVYIEKEGFSEALKDENWAERHDCMLISSKGFSSRAARDLIDKLAVHGEPTRIFCVHDADATGPMIYQTLQEATKARGARKITIINLGLEPWEAIAMGLEVETVEAGERREPVANYVLERTDRAPDGTTWADWLQGNRIELNTLTTPDFIRWLDGKMVYYDKLIPPPDVLAAELAAQLDAKVRAELTETILREAGFEDQVAAAIAATKRPTAAAMVKGIRNLFRQDQAREWRDHIKAIVANLRGTS